MKSADAAPATRWSAIAVFIALPLALIALTAMNFLRVLDNRSMGAQQEIRLADYQRRLRAPAADGKPVDTSPIYLGGSSPSLASADLQRRLVRAVAAASGKLIETAAVEPDASGQAEAAQPVRLRASLDIDNNGLLRLLFLLESGVPLLDIETISIRRLPAEEGAANREPVLRSELVVRGYWKPAPA